jgi:hypothetical protein
VLKTSGWILSGIKELSNKGTVTLIIKCIKIEQSAFNIKAGLPPDACIQLSSHANNMVKLLFSFSWMAISQHRTSVLFTSHPKDGLVVNLYISHNRWMPLQAEEALGPISIPQGSCGVGSILRYSVLSLPLCITGDG